MWTYFPQIHQPKNTVFANTTGQPYESTEQIREELVKQVVQGVHWLENIEGMIRAGCKDFCELGPRQQIKVFHSRLLILL